jgi:hypothetical protein
MLVFWVFRAEYGGSKFLRNVGIYSTYQSTKCYNSEDQQLFTATRTPNLRSNTVFKKIRQQVNKITENKQYNKRIHKKLNL